MKIGITYNIRENVLPEGELDSEQVEEFESPQTINAICSVFESYGLETARLGGDTSIIKKIKTEKPGFVFNIAEGYWGRSREAHIPAILELMNMPYSGSDPLTLALTLDKVTAKKILRQLGILTPNFAVIRKWSELINIEETLNYPLVVKPAWEGSSKGIYNTSKSADRNELRKSVKKLFERYPNQPLLIEEFVAGREFTIAVTGNNYPKILGLMEIRMKDGDKAGFIYSLEAKRNWAEKIEYIIQPNIEKKVQHTLSQNAILAFREFGCRDIARLDFRVSHENQVYLLDINPLPGLTPGYSDLVIMSEKSGITYNRLLMSILSSALSRYGIFSNNFKSIIKQAAVK